MMKLLTNQARFAIQKKKVKIDYIGHSPAQFKERGRELQRKEHMSSTAVIRSVNSSSPVLKQNVLVANYEISSAAA